MNKSTIIIEVRKNNFSGLYSIRVEMDKDESGKPIYAYNGNYSSEVKWSPIKSWGKKMNIDMPTIKDLKFFSDGFNYSYAWFDGYGKVIGK